MMMDLDTLPFRITDVVRPKRALDIEATVTAICVRGKDHVGYEITYFASGDLKTAWMMDYELVHDDKDDKLGFSRTK
jgi:hypothetical protein